MSAGADSLAAEIRARLGPPPPRAAWPPVSIVVPNRDGAHHLRRLLHGLVERTDYPDLELIVVDNDSSDDSLELLRSIPAPFPISILANHCNESFSDANNQGAELAGGELLLFMNNDAEPFEPGWLRGLVACLEASGAGAAGPTLLEPAAGRRPATGHVVQQRGLAVREVGNGILGAAFRDRGADPLQALGGDTAPLAVAAACLLIGREAFDAVGGFSHGYMYGPEDVDLALKLRVAGMAVACSGRSFVIHPMNSTLGTLADAERGAWVRANRRIFCERWGPRLRRELELDRLQGGGLWAEPAPVPPGPVAAGRRAELEALGYCLQSAAPGGAGDDGAPDGLLDALHRELRQRGVRCLALAGPAVDDLRALDHDVAVYLRGPARHLPKPAQLNVLWCVGDLDELTAIECARYDLVLTGSPRLADRLRADGLATPVVLSAGPVTGLATDLIAAVDRRAREIGFETRIGCN